MGLLGIIPARGGSKGIPHKNMQMLNNKPLVLHAVDTAIASGAFERIIVSSDNDAILNCVRTRQQIHIPYKRPAPLAQDNTLISSVIEHLLCWLEANEQYSPDAFMLLEPTCPLRSSQDIIESINVFQQSSNPCLISISPVQQHPSNMIYNNGDQWQYCLPRKQYSAGRQDFNDAWHINGGIYLTQSRFFLKTKLIYDLQCCDMYIMPYERSFDINTYFDLTLVRAYDELNRSKTREAAYA